MVGDVYLPVKMFYAVVKLKVYVHWQANILMLPVPCNSIHTQGEKMIKQVPLYLTGVWQDTLEELYVKERET
jgi:hypothetical protein